MGYPRANQAVGGKSCECPQTGRTPKDGRHLLPGLLPAWERRLAPDPPGMWGRTAAPPQGLCAEQRPVPVLCTTTCLVKPCLPVGSPGLPGSQPLPAAPLVHSPPVALSPGVVSEPASEMAQAGAVRSDAAGPDPLLHCLRAAPAHSC